MTADADRHVGLTLGLGEWWACEYPERPSEGYRTVYAPGRCTPCRIALQAEIANSSTRRRRCES